MAMTVIIICQRHSAKGVTEGTDCDWQGGGDSRHTGI
jgi:hypothetical protein